MKKVLIAYDSRTGKTEKMAEGIAEGIRMGGQEPELKKITQLKNEEEV
ncbi:MAG: flavodoxin domain-containing protein, partial [Syntrophobacteria bacterium]